MSMKYDKIAPKTLTFFIHNIQIKKINTVKWSGHLP